MLSKNVGLREDHLAVIILDQSALPNTTNYLELETAEQMYEAIQTLKIRGAPAIGICAGYCLYVLAVHSARGNFNYIRFYKELQQYADYLSAARPTAVNLSWALNRMLRQVKQNPDLSLPNLLHLLYDEALQIHKEDIAMCQAISQHGLQLLHDGMGILTHCNAGPLATSRYGTALGPLLLAKEQGMALRVFADETRPLLQGARLTTYELQQAGIDVTLICDNMAAQVMKNGWVDACFVGCDRVAMNGDTANKIGTSGIAILAKYYNIPFYVLGPSSTIDSACNSGEEIVIELRDPQEIREKFYKQPMAPTDVKCYNPAFDVTNHELITAIITEKGICRPPFCQSLATLFE